MLETAGEMIRQQLMLKITACSAGRIETSVGRTIVQTTLTKMRKQSNMPCVFHSNCFTCISAMTVEMFDIRIIQYVERSRIKRERAVLQLYF